MTLNIKQYCSVMTRSVTPTTATSFGAKAFFNVANER